MRKNLKLVIAGFSILLLLTCTGCDEKEKIESNGTEETPIVNNEEDVIKDQQVDVFSLTNTSLVYIDGNSTLVTEVTNTSSETAYIKSFNIIVKDSSGATMLTLLGYIGEELPAGETRTITSNTDMDLSTASSIEYTINK